MNTFKSLLAVVVMSIVVLAALHPAGASAAEVKLSSATMTEIQTILTKFGLPAGPIDGEFGPQTARGLCGFRMIAGLTPSRANASKSLLKKLRAYDDKYDSLSQISAPKLKKQTTYLLLQQKCQVMMYVEGGKYQRALPVSTGVKNHETPNGAYYLGYTTHNKGWHCSSKYPESCDHHKEGRFANISDYGNMYNRRFFKAGGYFVHGSTSVPTHPASHGCVRVTVTDSDWMYDHVGNGPKPLLVITGKY